MSSEAKDVAKCVEVEAVAEGPRVRAKRQLTPAQLENLRKGRERLAEKRKQQKLEKINEGNEDSASSSEEGKKLVENEENDSETEAEVEVEDDSNTAAAERRDMIYQEDEHVYPSTYCEVM